MHSLTLTISELKSLQKVFGVLTLIAFALCAIPMAWLGDGFTWTTVARAASPALAIAGLASAGLYGMTWRHPTVARWMNRPVVHGVWGGMLVSDFKAEKEGVELHIPIVFVIRQTYLTLSVQSYTPTQLGTSTLEALAEDTRTRDTRLRYVFELTRLYRNENKLTKGAGELRLQDRASVLRGFYWTSTPTHGELRLKLLSRDCDEIDSFEMARKRWPTQIGDETRKVPIQSQTVASTLGHP